MTRAFVGILVLCCIFLAGSPRAQSSGTVTESETGTSFPVSQSFGGTAHTMIGFGAFEAFGTVNVYGAAFYVDSDAGGRSWQRFLERQGASFVADGQVNWSGLKDSTQLYQWISSGSFGKAIHIKMVRDVSRQEVIDLHEDLMRDLVDDYDTAITQPPLKTYADATCVDSSVGDELRIWSRGSSIFVQHGSAEPIRIENASSIMRAVWSLWFGAHPISVPLRRGLVDRIENLGGPAPAQ